MLSSSVLYYYTSHITPAPSSCFFFFNDTATTEIYTLSLHDALPICQQSLRRSSAQTPTVGRAHALPASDSRLQDRKSTRLNSSHDQISYAVFCLKKKKKSRRFLQIQPRNALNATLRLIAYARAHTLS